MCNSKTGGELFFVKFSEHGFRGNRTLDERDAFYFLDSRTAFRIDYIRISLSLLHVGFAYVEPFLMECLTANRSSIKEECFYPKSTSFVTDYLDPFSRLWRICFTFTFNSLSQCYLVWQSIYRETLRRTNIFYIIARFIQNKIWSSTFYLFFYIFSNLSSSILNTVILPETQAC